MALAEGDSNPRNGLARGILENLAKFPHCLLLTRVGNFYEASCQLFTLTNLTLL